MILNWESLLIINLAVVENSAPFDSAMLDENKSCRCIFWKCQTAMSHTINCQWIKLKSCVPCVGPAKYKFKFSQC